MVIFVVGRVSDLLHVRKQRSVFSMEYDAEAQCGQDAEIIPVSRIHRREGYFGLGKLVKNINSFSDHLIATNWPIIDIIDQCTRGKVDYAMVTMKANLCNATSVQWDYLQQIDQLCDKISNARFCHIHGPQIWSLCVLPARGLDESGALDGLDWLCLSHGPLQAAKCFLWKISIG